jgi:hypothetical protein
MKQKPFILLYFSIVLILILLLVSITSYAQDSVQVKITSVKVKDSVTHVWMRGIKKQRDIDYYTACKCKVPYKEGDIVWIRKPEN